MGIIAESSFSPQFREPYFTQRVAQQLQSAKAPAPVNNTPAPAPQPTAPAYDPIAEERNRLRNEISSGWDNYLNNLNGMYSGLNDQRTAQENIYNTQYDQGVLQANTQKAKSLRDISDNIRSAFQAGNNYLGAMGASDSSAANQYSYALNKQSTKQISGVNEYTNGLIQNFAMERDRGINQVAQWFASAQNQIKQMQAQGQLNKSQDLANLSKDLLNQAISMVNQQNQTYQNRYDALLSWAASNSTNVNQLTSNIAGIPQAFATPQVNTSGNFQIPTGYGYSNTKEKNPYGGLFQNPSWFS